MVEKVVFTPAETGADKPAEVETKENNAVAVAAGGRPAWLPEQFKTAEDFAKSWTDQRAEITKLQQERAAPEVKAEEKPAATEEKKPVEGEQSPEQKAAAEAVAKAGVDVAPLQEEWTKTGDISEEKRAGLAKALESQFGAEARGIVDAYIEGQKAVSTNYQSEIYKHAGGQEQYTQIVAWATTGLSDADKANFNAAVNSGDVNKAKLALDGLSARYTKANGTGPKVIGGGHSGNDSTPGYASSYEMQQAIADPRYAKDAAYRKSVEEKIGKSNF